MLGTAGTLETQRENMPDSIGAGTPADRKASTGADDRGGGGGSEKAELTTGVEATVRVGKPSCKDTV